MQHNYNHNEQIDLTDEELISHYLYRKVIDSNFIARAIGEVDLNRVEPWELPWRAKLGEYEWFFFSVRDRKYPTGSRTNRATNEGYWKATGKDKQIFKQKSLVGMKKTLVFYRGRAPKGEKTNWVMHEYRLDGVFSAQNLTKSATGEWVISRVFHKNSSGQKIPISTNLPPLMEISSVESGSRTEKLHSTCYSDTMKEQQLTNDEETTRSWSSSSSLIASRTECVYPVVGDIGNYECRGSTWMQDPSILKILMDANNMNQNPKTEMVDDQDYGVNLGGQVDLDHIWDY